MTRRWRTCIGVLATALVLAAPAALASELAPDYEKLLEQAASAYVTVKFVPSSTTGEKQRETETTGVVIDPKGLVLCANTQLGGNPWGRPGATPTDIKVLIGDDTEGLKAELVARDSERDLAWVQITDPITSPLGRIDFEKSAQPSVGQRVLTIRLANKFFGRVPVVGETRVGGKYTKPRELYYVPGIDQVAEPGLPFFTAAGEVVGVAAIQVPELDTVRMMGRPLNPRDIMVILPAEQVIKATKLAREEQARKKAEETAAAETQDSPEAKPEDTPDEEGSKPDPETDEG